VPDFLDLLERRLSTPLTPARRIWLHKPRTLWVGFVSLHLVFLLALLPAILTGSVLGDLPLYRTWATLGLDFGYWQGIDTEWVYPIGALAPIAVAGVGGPHLYQFLWFLMTAALNAFAVGILTDWGRRAAGYGAAWWWLLLSFVLSPVGLLRLEGLTAPLVIAGLVLLAKRPIVASALLTVATWVKVWPAAVLLAVMGASRRRVTVVLTGVAITAAVIASVWAAGGLPFIAGFVTMQSDRGLQLEAPATTPWVWLAALGEPHTLIYQNDSIATREVIGPGTELVAAAMTPLMFTAVAVIFVLILVARQRTTDAGQLLLIGSLALVGAFVVFNKVGSPQYMLWIAPVIAVGVARSWRAWRVPAVLMLVISVLTTLVFPIFYLPLVDGDPLALALLTLRNGLLVVLLGWAVARLAILSGFRMRAVNPNRPPQFAGADR
jgi:Glycosyltransferase family 87